MKYLILAVLLAIGGTSFALEKRFSKDVNLYQSVKQEGGYYVYTYELENNEISEVNNISFGSDCHVAKIPRANMPFEVSEKNGKFDSNNLLTVTAGKGWDYSIEDSEDQSVTHISYSIFIPDQSVAKQLTKGVFPLFKVKSKKKIDSVYLDQSFCILADNAEWEGISKNKEWKEIDKKIDLTKIAKTCSDKIFVKPFSVDQSKPVCSVGQYDFQEYESEFNVLCQLNELYRNRKNSAANDPKLKKLAEGFDFAAAQKQMTNLKDQRNSIYQMFKMNCSLKQK